MNLHIKTNLKDVSKCVYFIGTTILKTQESDTEKNQDNGLGWE